MDFAALHAIPMAYLVIQDLQINRTLDERSKVIDFTELSIVSILRSVHTSRIASTHCGGTELDNT